MAGEFGLSTVLSWTSRSKICDVAGEESRGEPVKPRPGDEGRAKLCSPVGGHDGCFEDSLEASRDRGGLAGLEFALEGVCDSERDSGWDSGLELFVSGLESDFVSTEGFFLPRPNKLRILLFPSFFVSSL